MPAPLNNPKAIADAGESIYQKQRTALEAAHLGEYAAINVMTEEISLGATPEAAFTVAKAADPNGIFHLVRIGYSGAFQMSYQSRHGASDWLFG